MAKDTITASSTMASESNTPETVPIKATFFRHRSAFIYCSVTCLGGLQLGALVSISCLIFVECSFSSTGIDLGSISGMQAMPGFLKVFGFPDKTATFGYGISPTVQQLINSLMSLGAFVGCMACGPLGTYIGRKWSLALAIVMNQLGVILMMAGDDLGALYAGRFIIGLANGLFDVIPQLYIHECAPALQRGSLLRMFNVLVGVGLLIGAIVDNYTATLLTRASYQIPLGIFLVCPMIIAVLLPFLPETPRWLVRRRSIPFSQG